MSRRDDIVWAWWLDRLAPFDRAPWYRLKKRLPALLYRGFAGYLARTQLGHKSTLNPLMLWLAGCFLFVRVLGLLLGARATKHLSHMRP